MNFKQRSLLALMSLALLAGTAPAMAGTATGTIASSVTLGSDCSVSVQPLAFGSLSSLTSTATNVTSTIAVNCTKGTGYSVRLSSGAGNGATNTVRVMTGTLGGTLNYALYQNNSHANVWGDTLSPSNVVTGTGSGASVNWTVYGSIPSGQIVVPDSYADTVTVSVVY